jgi:glucose-6-phosphate 1-dehydrogenase
MDDHTHPSATILVIFGGAGDLTWRKLAPALYNLEVDGWLPEKFAVIGVDGKSMTEDEFRDHLRDGVSHFSRRGKPADAGWSGVASRICFICADFGDPRAYNTLKQQLLAREKEWQVQTEHVFYLAVPPGVFPTIVQGLGKAGLAEDREHSRIVIEKPFGHDLASARALTETLTSVYRESQIYRIDHYLGKETVQNILAFRFANAVFEPIWNRRYIDHVQITVAENVGVEHRGGYYENAGALRDMVQNHLLQLMCMVAMEPMVSFQADEIRNKKADVLHAIRPIPKDDVFSYAVRGQYGAGWMQGEHVVAYRAEPGVAPDSSAETFAALKLFVDNWRWQDVPFYLRTGKRLPLRVSEVSIQFLPVPHKSFPGATTMNWQANRLVLRIQPEEGILLRFEAKQPGPSMRLSPVDMEMTYCRTFKADPPEAYETLLLDVMRGDATLFMRADQVDAAWNVLAPVLDTWQAVPPIDFPNYPAGTWGPEDAEALIARDGRSWVVPTVMPDQEKTIQEIKG